MLAKRDLVPNGSATAKGLDYSLKRWVAPTRYLDHRAVPIDTNQVKTRYDHGHLVAHRTNWLFAGSLRSGERAAAIMSLIQSARINGHDPYTYLKDVLTRLPTQRASETYSCHHISGGRLDLRKVSWADAYYSWLCCGGFDR